MTVTALTPVRVTSEFDPSGWGSPKTTSYLHGVLFLGSYRNAAFLGVANNEPLSKRQKYWRKIPITPDLEFFQMQG